MAESTLDYMLYRAYKATGRADLVTSIDEAGHTAEKNGMSYYIRSGVRLLDLLQQNLLSSQRSVVEVLQGEYTVDVELCRAVESVWITDGTNGRVQLQLVSQEWLLANYKDQWNAATQGTPQYYALNVNTPAPMNQDDDATTLAGMQDWQDLNIPLTTTVMSLVFLPPADTTYTLTVYGKYFTDNTFTNLTDSCFWFTMYPDLVTAATAYSIEVEMRNSEGMKDWLSALKLKLSMIDFDLAEQDSNGLVRMEG